MKVIGLTGNIGSGKSTVGQMLASLGAAVIDCDMVSRRLVEPGMPCLRQIAAVFGEEYLLPDGSLNRKKMAANIFSNPAAKEKLEQILHPAITDEVKRQIAAYDNSGTDCVVLEAPLLIEAGLMGLVDTVWLVVSSREELLARLEQRRGYSRQQGEAALANQMPDTEKIPYADVIIENNGSLTDLQEKVRLKWQACMIDE